MMKRILPGTAKMLLAILAMILIVPAPVSGQEVLDVLPEDGRKELFHAYLMDELNTLHLNRLDDLQASVATIELCQQRQQRLRDDYRMLIGDLPDKTPLNPNIVKTIDGDGYKIDVVTYESRPNHHITANFYYPTTGDGPWPGIYFSVGHYSTSKSTDLMQQLCIMLAKNGFATLIADPMCQLERYQIIKPGTDELRYIGESGTKQHSLLDVGAMLTGTSVMAYELWDNHRGVDYLISRSEVDPDKIGNTGDSGGGAQGTYLAAFDERIDVSVICSYIMNEPTLYGTIGPQTGSQNLSFEGYYGIDHPEYIAMFAPKPFMVICDSLDFFNIAGSQETKAEAESVYSILGEAEKFGYTAFNTGHGYNHKTKREAAVQWFRKWFYDDDNPVSEGSETLQSTDNLKATTSGQVFYDFENEVVVEQYNAELAKGYADDRSSFWSTQTKDSCLNMVKELIMLEETADAVTAEVVETIDRGDYDIEKIKLTSGNLVPITGLLFIPHSATGQSPAVLYIDGKGKSNDADAAGIIEKVYVDSGKIVFAVDVRGFGETADLLYNEAKHENNEHRNAVISGYTGKTLIGQRVQDISIAKDYLSGRTEVDPSALSIVGIDRAATSVLHAAALDPDFKEVALRGMTDTSWVSIVESPITPNNMTHVVPSALKFYDLPDLENAISPRPVVYQKSMESRLSRMSISGGKFSPAFDAAVFEYDVIEAKRTAIKITPYLKDNKAIITGGGTYNLGDSVFTVEIIILAEDGITQSVYTINMPVWVSIGDNTISNNHNDLLKQNYPNPFDLYTTISYQVPAAGKVSLKVYNQLSQEVAVLVDNYQDADRYEFELDGSTFSSGIYMYQLTLDGMAVDVKKMSVIKD